MPVGAASPCSLRKCPLDTPPISYGVPSPLVCSLSLSSPSVCELTETSVIMDNTSHKAAREAVDLEVVDADLADLVILCAHGLGNPRAS